MKLKFNQNAGQIRFLWYNMHIFIQKETKWLVGIKSLIPDFHIKT